jgi:hypothetical protein
MIYKAKKMFNEEKQINLVKGKVKSYQNLDWVQDEVDTQTTQSELLQTRFWSLIVSLMYFESSHETEKYAYNTTNKCEQMCEGQIGMHHDHERKRNGPFRVLNPKRMCEVLNMFEIASQTRLIELNVL